MRLPDGKNVAARQAVQGSAPCARTCRGTIIFFITAISTSWTLERGPCRKPSGGGSDRYSLLQKALRLISECSSTGISFRLSQSGGSSGASDSWLETIRKSAKQALSVLPGRIFLDTCVVNFMLDYGEQIHDGTPATVDAGERVVRDIEALHNIWLVGQRATWQLAISPHTYQEIAATHDARRRHRLQTWFADLWQYWQIHHSRERRPSELCRSGRYSCSRSLVWQP